MSKIRFFPLRAFALVFAVAIALVFGKVGGESFDIRDPEACKLHFTILSDVHVETNNWKRYPAFTRGLICKTARKSKVDPCSF